MSCNPGTYFIYTLHGYAYAAHAFIIFFESSFLSNDKTFLFHVDYALFSILHLVY